MLCVLTPLIPLAYLSVKSITGEREGIASRIRTVLERQANLLVKRTTATVLDCENEIASALTPSSGLDDLTKRAATAANACPYVRGFFILDSRLSPLFPFGTRGSSAPKSAAEEQPVEKAEHYESRMREGAGDEFASGNTRRALMNYKLALRSAASERSRAIATNAIARCYFKMARYAEASSYYSRMLAGTTVADGLCMKLLASYRLALVKEKSGLTSRTAQGLLDIVNALAAGKLASNVYEASFYAAEIRRKSRDLLTSNNIRGEFNRAFRSWDRMERTAVVMERLREQFRPNFQKILGTVEEHFTIIPAAVGGEEDLLAARKLFLRVPKTAALFVAILDVESLKEETARLIRDSSAPGPEVNVTLYGGEGETIASEGDPKTSSSYETERSLAPLIPGWRLRLSYRRDGMLFQIASSRRRTRLSYIAFFIAVILIGLYVTYRSVKKDSELARLKSEFVSRVSHELRTPLATIRAMGEMLELGAVPSREKEKEYFSVITSESERLTRLINNVLDFSRIGAGERTYNLKTADVKKTVTNTVSAFTQYVKSEGYDILFEADDHIPEARIDDDAISQALINLMDNAVKFSRTEKVIRVSLRRADDEIRISVKDRGIGIPASEIKKIFDRFYRPEEARRVSGKGAGIGLSIVKHIAEAHGGRIEVESTHGVGSAFTLVLPIANHAELEG